MAGLFVLAVFSFMACFPAVIAPDNPSADIYMVGQGPSAQHLLGTTSYGQDIFSQLIWGRGPRFSSPSSPASSRPCSRC